MTDNLLYYKLHIKSLCSAAFVIVILLISAGCSPIQPTNTPLPQENQPTSAQAGTVNVRPRIPTPLITTPGSIITATPLPTSTDQQAVIFPGQMSSNERGEIVRAVFLPGAKQVVVAWSSGISLNSVDTGRELWYQAASKKILAFDVQPGGQLFAAALSDGGLEVFSADGGETNRFGNPQPNAEWGDIAWSPDGQILAFQFIGDRRNDPISLLHMDTGQIDQVPDSQTARGVIPALVWSPDGSAILVAALDEQYPRFIDVLTGEQRMRMAYPGKMISSMPLFLPDGKTLASEGPDGTVELLSYPDGALLRAFPGDTRLLGRQLIMFPDAGGPLFVDSAGKWIADRGGYEPCYCGSGDIPSDYPLVIWDLRQETVLAQLSQPLPALASSHRLAVMFDGSSIVMLYENGEITRWAFDGPRSKETMVSSLEVRPNKP